MPLPARTKGGHRVNHKLTPEQVREIEERRARGQSTGKIAYYTGIKESSVIGVVYLGNGARTLHNKPTANAVVIGRPSENAEQTTPADGRSDQPQS